MVRQDLNLQQHGCKPCALPLSYGPKMAGLAGLEPATLCFEGTCSLRLSYRPTWSARWDLHPHPLACHASAPLLSYEPLLVLLAGFEPALYSFSNCCLCRWATGAYGASGGICTPSANGSGFTDRPGSLAPKLTHTFAYIVVAYKLRRRLGPQSRIRTWDALIYSQLCYHCTNCVRLCGKSTLHLPKNRTINPMKRTWCPQQDSNLH